MSMFIIKIIAYVTMVLDHVKYINLNDPMFNNVITKYFGRMAFPLFAFMISEGYVHTKNLKKYYNRLIAIALISQVPFMIFRTLVGDWKILNILFTLLLGLLCITAFDKIEKKYLSIPICIGLIALGKLINVDYRLVWSSNGNGILLRQK